MALEFTEKADSQMADLASRTGGLAFFYSGRDNSTGLVDAFMQCMGSPNSRVVPFVQVYRTIIC